MVDGAERHVNVCRIVTRCRAAEPFRSTDRFREWRLPWRGDVVGILDRNLAGSDGVTPQAGARVAATGTFHVRWRASAGSPRQRNMSTECANRWRCVPCWPSEVRESDGRLDRASVARLVRKFSVYGATSSVPSIRSRSASLPADTGRLRSRVAGDGCLSATARSDYGDGATSIRLRLQSARSRPARAASSSPARCRRSRRPRDAVAGGGGHLRLSGDQRG